MQFSEFWNALITQPLLIPVVLMVFGVCIVNGFTDAPNAIATCISTRSLGVWASLILAMLFNIIGLIVMGLVAHEVSNTIQEVASFGDDPKIAMLALIGALSTVVFWSCMALKLGLPTSESHSLIAGLTGASVAVMGNFSSVSGGAWLKVVLGLVLSTFLGFFLGYAICKLIALICKKCDKRKTDVFFRYAQIGGAAAMAFMHGAQDGLKFLGVLLIAVVIVDPSLSGAVTSAPPVWLLCVIPVFMSIGTLIGGKKIIKSVGMDMVKLEKYQGSAADMASALGLLFCSLTGIPVSTTHMKTTAIMGVGATKRFSAINLGVVRRMVTNWLLVFPGCGLIAFGITKLLLLFV